VCQTASVTELFGCQGTHIVVRATRNSDDINHHGSKLFLYLLDEYFYRPEFVKGVFTAAYQAEEVFPVVFTTIRHGRPLIIKVFICGSRAHFDGMLEVVLFERLSFVLISFVQIKGRILYSSCLLVVSPKSHLAYLGISGERYLVNGRLQESH